jgi:hypothetical protein
MIPEGNTQVAPCATRLSASGRFPGRVLSRQDTILGHGDRRREKKRQPVKVGVFSLFLVARGGIEPPTQGFSILCSTN